MNRKKRKESALLKLIYHRVTITLIGLVVLVSISIPLAKNVSKQYRINNEIKELETEITRLESKNTELKKLMDYLESDQFIEEQARLNLSYKKADESVVVVKPQDEGKDSVSGAGEDGADSNNYAFTEGSSSNIGNWWRFFFN